ncbi:MAG: hypothetical protein WBF77_12040, partial [Sulfurimonadaceae bacterium]
TNPKKIYIIDSDSPVKPTIDPQKEELISLHENAGHPTLHIGKLSGVSRAHLLGMSIAMANEVDYWVYIEQDALIYGENIIEKCIDNMKKPYMFGSGRGTPQPVQHSLMIIRKDGIPTFIKNFNAIKAKDSEISVERKFAIATSLPLRLVPEFVYKYMERKSSFSELLDRLFRSLYFTFQGFDDIPIGYGRQRPIDFSKSHFYFQHGDQKELEAFLKKSNIDQKF